MVIKLSLDGTIFKIKGINKRIHRKLAKGLVEFKVNKDSLYYLDENLSVRYLNVGIVNLSINDYDCGYRLGKDELLKHILYDIDKSYIVTTKNKVILDK